MPRHDVLTVFTVRGEPAMEPGEDASWARNRCRQAGNEIEGIQDDVRCAVAKGLLELVKDLPALIGREALVCHRRESVAGSRQLCLVWGICGAPYTMAANNKRTIQCRR